MVFFTLFVVSKLRARLQRFLDSHHLLLSWLMVLKSYTPTWLVFSFDQRVVLTQEEQLMKHPTFTWLCLPLIMERLEGQACKYHDIIDMVIIRKNFLPLQTLMTVKNGHLTWRLSKDEVNWPSIMQSCWFRERHSWKEAVVTTASLVPPTPSLVTLRGLNPFPNLCESFLGYYCFRVQSLMRCLCWIFFGYRKQNGREECTVDRRLLSSSRLLSEDFFISHWIECTAEKKSWAGDGSSNRPAN